MVQALILYEKHETRYIYVPEYKLDDIIIYIIKKRNTAGWWYTELEPKEQKWLALALTDDFRAATKFFNSRKNAEYENWEVIDLEEIILPQ